MFEAEPAWVTDGCWALASVLGTIGALAAVLRRRAAVPLLLASLIVPSSGSSGCCMTPQLRDLLDTSEHRDLVVALALGWTIYWFARHSRQRGWLR